MRKFQPKVDFYKLDLRYFDLLFFKRRSIMAVDASNPKAQNGKKSFMDPKASGLLYVDGGIVTKKPNEFGDEWRIDYDHIEELPGIAKIVKELNKPDVKTKMSLVKKINEASNNESPKKSLIEWINFPSTFAAFIGFLSVEIGTYIYPITYNHLIGVIIALFAFVIFTIFNKRKK